MKTCFCEDYPDRRVEVIMLLSLMYGVQQNPCGVCPSVASRPLWSVQCSPLHLHFIKTLNLTSIVHFMSTQGWRSKFTRSLTLLSGDIWEAPHGVAMELDWSEVIKTDTACLWGCKNRVWGLDLRIYPVHALATKGGTVKSVASGCVSALGLLIYLWIQLQQPGMRHKGLRDV